LVWEIKDASIRKWHYLYGPQSILSLNYLSILEVALRTACPRGRSLSPTTERPGDKVSQAGELTFFRNIERVTDQNNDRHAVFSLPTLKKGLAI
jgi:hypothetical protein